MATDTVPVPNPVQYSDARVLIGGLAIPESAIWGNILDEQTTTEIAQRFVREGLLAADHDERDLRQVISDLNQRIRYAVGE